MHNINLRSKVKSPYGLRVANKKVWFISQCTFFQINNPSKSIYSKTNKQIELKFLPKDQESNEFYPCFSLFLFSFSNNNERIIFLEIGKRIIKFFSSIFSCLRRSISSSLAFLRCSNWENYFKVLSVPLELHEVQWGALHVCNILRNLPWTFYQHVH